MPDAAVVYHEEVEGRLVLRAVEHVGAEVGLLWCSADDQRQALRDRWVVGEDERGHAVKVAGAWHRAPARMGVPHADERERAARALLLLAGEFRSEEHTSELQS